MSATTEGDPYPHATALASELREDVADQLHDLVLEREEFGSEKEVVEKIHELGQLARRIAQARGQQRQALEMGLPRAPAVKREREARDLLRAAVLGLGASCGSWAVALDFEAREAA